RHDLLADQAAHRLGIRVVDPELEPSLAAVGLRLLAPHAEERAHDPVLAGHLDAGCGPARGEPVEDRLDLVGERVAGRAAAAGVEGVAALPQLGLARLTPVSAADFGTEPFGAEARVAVRFCAAQAVVDVQAETR